jgi:hypothetical protein
MIQLRLLPFAIPELFAQASTTRTLTQADCYGLLAAVLEDSLVDEERAAVDRLLHAVYRGRIQPVKEISAIL